MSPRPREQLDRPLTHRDLDDTPEDGNLYEVIDGALHVTPFPDYPHQESVGQLFTQLNVHVRAKGLGKVFPSGLKVVLDEPTGVGPDIVFVSQARMDGMREDGFHGVPDLIVEVLSSRPERDRVVKAAKYARAGVPHYWIVDPRGGTLRAYRLEAGHYALAAEARDRFEPELFPGLTLDVTELWV
jgi:Uma2 family endonuclease